MTWGRLWMINSNIFLCKILFFSLTHIIVNQCCTTKLCLLGSSSWCKFITFYPFQIGIDMYTFRLYVVKCSNITVWKKNLSPGLASGAVIRGIFCQRRGAYLHVSYQIQETSQFNISRFDLNVLVVLASHIWTQVWISEIFRICCTNMQLSHGNWQDRCCNSSPR